MSMEAPPAGTMADTGNRTLNQPVPDPRDHGEKEEGGLMGASQPGTSVQQAG